MSKQLRISLAAGVVILSATLLAGLRPEARAEDKSAAPKVHFNRDIRPILSNSCFKCHGPDLKKGGLDLQNRDSATKPLRSGEPAVVPGNSAESVLIRKITAEEDSDRMPPPGKGERLKPEQVARLRAWIDQGAKWE